MEILLISDEKADMSAASIDVKIGDASDPLEFQGIAHFLEHMMFMGSKKYPDEKEYSKYIEEHGGYGNAATSDTNTNYYFDTSNKAFEGALDRFSSVFITPSFAKNSTNREIKAVEDEYRKTLQSDYWRKQAVLKDISHPESMIHKNTFGNLKLLNHTGLREALFEFHKKWYSANIMKLVLSSN